MEPIQRLWCMRFGTSTTKGEFEINVNFVPEDDKNDGNSPEKPKKCHIPTSHNEEEKISFQRLWCMRFGTSTTKGEFEINVNFVPEDDKNDGNSPEKPKKCHIPTSHNEEGSLKIPTAAAVVAENKKKIKRTASEFLEQCPEHKKMARDFKTAFRDVRTTVVEAKKMCRGPTKPRGSEVNSSGARANLKDENGVSSDDSDLDSDSHDSD